MGGYLESINDPNVGNIHRLYLPRVEAGASQSALLSSAVTA